MRTISAERFEARCLSILDEVKRRREPVFPIESSVAPDERIRSGRPDRLVNSG